MNNRFGDNSFTRDEIADIQYREKVARANGRDAIADSLISDDGYRSAIRDYDAQRAVKRMHSGRESYLDDGEAI